MAAYFYLVIVEVLSQGYDDSIIKIQNGSVKGPNKNHEWRFTNDADIKLKLVIKKSYAEYQDCKNEKIQIRKKIVRATVKKHQHQFEVRQGYLA